MKIKRILLSVLALALVAALSVGATLAFLSAEDTKVTNNFSFGGIQVQIVEEDPNNKVDDQGNKLLPGSVVAETTTPEEAPGIKAITYKKVTPGDKIPKEPVISVKTDVAAYVFIKISGFDDNLTCDGITSGWIPVTDTIDSNRNGIYYREVGANTSMTEVASAFESVTVSSDCTGVETLPTIYVDVFAIQSENITLEQATAEANASFALEA